MFRRPKKAIRPRVITIDPEDDDGDMDDLPAPSPPRSSKNNGISFEPPKIQKENKKSLISFDEEEEEGEVFKVKKSSVSRRLMKQREKVKKNPNFDIDDNFLPVRVKEEVKDEDDVRILNGRDAEAVHMESEDEEEEEDALKFRRPGELASEAAVRRALESGQIPDANLIHEARKRRQLARESAVDFIAVDPAVKYKSEKSRLVREDDNDNSGDEDGDRLDFSKVANPQKWESDKRREVFEAAQENDNSKDSDSDSDDEDPEMDEWERQQISKGVSQTQMHNVAQEVFQQRTMAEYSHYEATGNFSSFSSYETQQPQQPTKAADTIQAIFQPLQNIQELLGRKMTPESAIKDLNNRLEKLRVSKERNAGAIGRLKSDLALLDVEVESLSGEKPELSAKFGLYQNLRGYVTDLVDCLRCKIPIIEMVEKRMLELLRSRSERLISRRHGDIDDQREEVQASIPMTTGGPITIPPPNEVKSRRAAEREGRRTRRRRAREFKGTVKHKDGLSSDDEETEFDGSTYRNARDLILSDAERVMGDVNEEFGTIEGILDHFEEWRSKDLPSYTESYAYMCLPKCLGPLIRLQLLKWDPISDNFDLVDFSWMKSLLIFGSRKNETVELILTDPDTRLIPAILEKIIIPWIGSVVNISWDPLSGTRTRRLYNIINKMIHEWSVGPNSKPMHALMKTIISKFQDSLEADVYIPIYPKPAMGRGSQASIFCSRQFWSSVKLLHNMSTWQGLISDKVLQTLALDALLTRYVLLGIRISPEIPEAAERARGVVDVLPRPWLCRENEKEFPNGLQQLIRCLVSVVQTGDIASTNNRAAIQEMGGILKKLGANEEARMIVVKYS